MQNHLCQTLVISLHHRPDAINVPCDKDVQFKGQVNFLFTEKKF